MSDKLNNILQNLQSEYSSILKEEGSTQHINKEIEEIVNSTFDKLHNQIDQESELFMQHIENYIINYGNESFSHSDKNDSSQPGEAGNDAVDVKTKIKNLMSTLESMIDFTTKNEEIIKYVNEAPLEKLITINRKENRIDFKNVKIDKRVIYGSKNFVDVNWSKTQAAHKNTTKVSSDGKTLILNNTSCWNFQSSEEEFSEGVVEFNIEVENLSGDDHFYLGICNESKNLKTNSGCLCCANPNTWYFDRTGQISCDNSAKIDKISISKDQGSFKVTITCDFDNKTIFFKDENTEKGPFNIKGEKFKLLSSTCNNFTGTVKITN